MIDIKDKVVSDKKEFVYIGEGETPEEALACLKQYQYPETNKIPARALVLHWLTSETIQEVEAQEGFQDLFESFKAFSPKINAHISRNLFASALKSFGFRSQRQRVGSRQLRFYTGICLKDTTTHLEKE